MSRWGRLSRCKCFICAGSNSSGPAGPGVFVNLAPVFGAIMAVALLGEPFAAYRVVALILVVGGIAVAHTGAGRAR